MGHCANKCPQRKAEKAEAFTNATWNAELEGYIYMSVQWEDQVKEEYVVNNVVNTTQTLAPTEVLLDIAADISFIHPMLSIDIQEAERKNRVKGVGGVQLIVDETGKLDGFFQVYASTKTKANVLSFAAVKDLYDITYIHREAFIVHMPGKDLVFKHRDKLYIAE